MNPIDVEAQIVSNASPSSKQAERERIAKEVERYLAAGGVIKQEGGEHERER